MDNEYEPEWKLLGIVYAYKQGDFDLTCLSKQLAKQVKTIASRTSLEELKSYNKIRQTYSNATNKSA